MFWSRFRPTFEMTNPDVAPQNCLFSQMYNLDAVRVYPAGSLVSNVKCRCSLLSRMRNAECSCRSGLKKSTFCICIQHFFWAPGFEIKLKWLELLLNKRSSTCKTLEDISKICSSQLLTIKKYVLTFFVNALIWLSGKDRNQHQPETKGKENVKICFKLRRKRYRRMAETLPVF